MRIRALEVRNWACIESLSLGDFHDGIIVLHGPNRTGKSSLVQAIRSCLFDHDHDSQKREILDASPRRTKTAPQVSVEFEQAGQRYRMSKTFAKTKEGIASLDQFSAGGWTTVVRGKDASKRVRELIGAGSSFGGIFQMLWLGQQDFRLPTPRDVDPSLAKALEAVLGTLITGRDINFKERLDKASERWFTVKTMKDRKDSPVTKLMADLELARTHKADVDGQWNDAESALRQYDEVVARLPDLRRNLEEAEAELDRVSKERESIALRKSRHELAVKNRDGEAMQLKAAQGRLEAAATDEMQFTRAEAALAESQRQFHAADEKWTHAQNEAKSCREQLDLSERELLKHQQSRAAIDDRQEWLTLANQCLALERNLEQAEEWSKTRLELEARQAGPAIFASKRIEELRANRTEAMNLRAQLEAGEIQVTIQVKQPLPCGNVIDGQPGESQSLAADGEHRWLIRQQAKFTLGNLATIRVGRVQEDRNLEEMVLHLANLDRVYHQALSEAKMDAQEPAPLDVLLMRRVEHEGRSKELKRLRDDLARMAPDGIASLQAQRQQLRQQQESIAIRRPDLRDWIPNQAELELHKSTFAIVEAELRGKVDDAKKTRDQAATSSQDALKAQQEISTRIASQSFEVQSLKAKLALIDRAMLYSSLENARARLAEADAKVEESTLSEAEHAIETRYQAIRGAHANRNQRLHANENQLAELRGRLAGTEGLHQKRIQAEQAVNDLARDLERETHYAQAHKHLKELFECVRQEQVRRTVGPINDRVMSWAKQLGLTEYAGLSFGDQLLPGGLLPAHAVDGEAVELHRESFGTLEQLSLLIRLAVGGLLSRSESAVAILDDPLAHADLAKHRKMLEILARATSGEAHGPHPTGPLQLIILTCHEERFDYLEGAQQFDLAQLIRRGE